MNDKNSAQDFFNLIKTTIDNYMKARKTAAMFIGTYEGNVVKIGELPVPISMITGNMKGCMVPGDKIRLLRNDGGREYFILEIIGKPYRIIGE